MRRHYYHVEWQALNTWAGLDQLAALPLGRYRLHVTGQSRDPADLDYPYDGLPWEQSSEPFEVVPAVLELIASVDAATLTLDASYGAAARGYRLLHAASAPDTPTPLVPAAAGITVSGSAADGAAGALAPLTVTDAGDLTRITVDLAALGSSPDETWTFTVDDGWGNSASAAVVLP